MLKGKNILVIDDADAIRMFLRISLQASGASFHEASTATDGVRLCQQASPDLVVLDLGLPDKDGLDILPELKSTSHAPKVIILSVRKDQRTKDKAFMLGADAYLTKPFMMEDMMEVIEHMISPGH